MSGRIMGLDYGSKTVGVAVSDDRRSFAMPKETIQRDSEKRQRKTLARIEELVRENNIETIVVGLPLLPDGSEGERAEKARDFAEKVRLRTGLDVILLDERYTTTASAEELDEMQIPKEEQKTYIDQLAACHILEEYLHR
ncbi:MAG: Holliday junction resolvase RuvX [Lachnospiraceae bacterium]|nr:Holliday junction resolvase RuvX [Lachnospiraceae bacterium]